MINPMDMTGRCVIVTGSAQGIGLHTARLLSQLGAAVVLVDLKADALAEAAADFPPERTLVVPGSVTDRAFVKDLVAQAAARFGGVHGLVNNAGITRPAMIEKMTAEDWQAVIDVNQTGVFNILQAVGTEMLARGRAGEENPGAVVNISSEAGLKGSVGQINYSAAKAAILGMTMSAAREWGKYGIRVNSVAYGIVETPMTEVARSERFRDTYLNQIPLQRFLKPEDAAYSIVFLLSGASRHITGQHLAVNGGSHMDA